MGFFEKMAYRLFHIATGDEKRRWFYTPVVAFLFLCFLALFFIAAFTVDGWLHLPSIVFLPWTFILALILLIPGLILVLWTWTLFLIAHGTPVPINPPQKLVTTGPYSLSRNPMLTGIYLVFFGIGLWIGSLSLTFIFIPILIVLLTLEIIKIEEKELELQFGQKYLDYKKKVPMYLLLWRRRV
jgi:protein-S-isoprenylcysteine O-methyltransferase Ste14